LREFQGRAALGGPGVDYSGRAGEKTCSTAKGKGPAAGPTAGGRSSPPSPRDCGIAGGSPERSCVAMGPIGAQGGRSTGPGIGQARSGCFGNIVLTWFPRARVEASFSRLGGPGRAALGGIRPSVPWCNFFFRPALSKPSPAAFHFFARPLARAFLLFALRVVFSWAPKAAKEHRRIFVKESIWPGPQPPSLCAPPGAKGRCCGEIYGAGRGRVNRLSELRVRTKKLMIVAAGASWDRSARVKSLRGRGGNRWSIWPR